MHETYNIQHLEFLELLVAPTWHIYGSLLLDVVLFKQSARKTPSIGPLSFGGASEISGPRPIARVRAGLFPSQTPQTPPRHARHPSATQYSNLVCRCECLSSFDSPIPRYFDITLHDPRDTLQPYLLEVVLVLSGQSLRP